MARDGSWGDRSTALPFEIEALWWQTIWARLAALAGLASLVVGAFQLRVNRVRTHELAAQVEARTVELRNALTELEAQRAEIESQNDQLRDADRLKSNLVANVSHEFRTPLQLVLGSIQQAVATGDGTLSDDTRELLASAERNALRVSRLVGNLFDASRLESGAMTLQVRPVDLAAFTETVVREFLPAAERAGVDLTFDSDPGHERPLLASIDDRAMETILGNLLSNALRFTLAGGRIRVTAAREGQMAIVRLRDTGAGIPAEALPHVFDRFYQVTAGSDRDRDGAGIGLSIASELARLQGGWIEAASEGPGFGSTFELSVPLLPAEYSDTPSMATPDSERLRPHIMDAMADLIPEDEAASLPEGLSETSLARVLVVDDNPEIRRLLVQQLAPEFQVWTARSAAEGLSLARETHPDLLLVDIMMPSADGLSLVASIRADDLVADAAVVLLTARGGADNVRAGLEAGADDYVEKPYDITELKARLRRHIERRAELRARFSEEVVLKQTGVKVKSKDVAWLELAYEVVGERLSEHAFDAWAFALDMNLSVSQLNRRLRPLVGFAAGGFIRELRLQRAAELLTARAGGVREVAEAIGFKDVDHFSQLFRERWGVPPSAYPPA
jgi:signal transduction histidine kinase/DNA-binding response OmpR family regulator